MDYISFGLSILALSGTIYTYLKHDKKLKSQESRLNEYQLKKIGVEEIENKKALIKGNLLKGDKGKRTLKVFNSGKAIAHNIRFEVIEGEDGFLFVNNEIFPFEFLNPQDGTEIIFHVHMDSPDKIKVKFFWDDSFKKDNEFIQVFSI